MDKPTFTPSLMANKDTPFQCHIVLTNGILNFCADCCHELKGQAVPMVDWDTIIGKEEGEEEMSEQPKVPTDAELSAFMQARGYSYRARLAAFSDREQLKQLIADYVESKQPPAAAQQAAESLELSTENTKRCPACGTHYPMGYTHCPHDNTQLPIIAGR